MPPEANPAMEQRRRMIAALAAQQQQIDILRTEAAQHAEENSRLRRAVAFIAQVAGIADQPHIAALNVTADVNNPANPEPSKGSEAPSQTTDQALKPAATDSVDAPGEVPASANKGVTPATTTDVTKPGEVLPAPRPDDMQDVEKMVSGTDKVPSPSEAKVPIDIQAPAPPEPSKTMFSDTGWTASANGEQGEHRLLTSMRLARLRRAAGIEDGDDLALSQAIHDDTSLTDADIAHEIDVLSKVVEKRTAATQQRTAGRNLVPQRAQGVQRAVPSLAPQGDEGGITTTASVTDGVSDDELGFL